MIPRLKFAERLALIALLLAAVAAAAGLLVSGVYRDTADGVRQASATDLVTLLGAVPALALGLWRARAGSAGGRLVAVGALAYLAYSYAIYAFSVVIDPLTPVHIAILGLATWSLLLTVFGLDDATVDGASRFRLSRRASGGFLIVVAVLFATLWLSQIAHGNEVMGSMLGKGTVGAYAFLVPALAGLALAFWPNRRDKTQAV